MIRHAFAISLIAGWAVGMPWGMVAGLMAFCATGAVLYSAAVLVSLMR